jgi:uncharacterized protein (DUF58 family)
VSLTPRGRTLLIVGGSFLAFGRTFALRELTMLGAGSMAVVAIGAVAIWLRRGTVTVKRRVHPVRAPAGSEVRVDLALTSQGQIGTAPLLVTEKIPDVLGDDIRLTVDPGGRQRSVAYVFKPKVRGRYDLGPLQLVNTDPFGALMRSRDVEGTSTLIVYPAYERVGTMPTGVQRMGAVRHSPRLGQGDEFYGLRPYVVGDDLRKCALEVVAQAGATARPAGRDDGRAPRTS